MGVLDAVTCLEILRDLLRVAGLGDVNRDDTAELLALRVADARGEHLGQGRA